MNKNIKENGEIENLLKTITYRGKNNDKAVVNWLTSCISSKPGYKGKTLIIFDGKQGCGKTSWFKSIYSKRLNDLCINTFLLADTDNEIYLSDKIKNKINYIKVESLDSKHNINVDKLWDEAVLLKSKLNGGK